MEARLGDRAARSGRISVDYAILQLAINFVEALGRDLCRCCVVVQPSCTKTAEKGEKGRTAKNKVGLEMFACVELEAADTSVGRKAGALTAVRRAERGLN